MCAHEIGPWSWRSSADVVTATLAQRPAIFKEFENAVALIAPRTLFEENCLACHSQNNLAMPLTTDEETRPWARAIEDEILRRHMPPWRAAPGYGPFVNNNALTNRELQFLVAWIEGKGPKSKDQGNVNFDQHQTPAVERLTLDVATSQLGMPDLLKALPATSVAVGQKDPELRRRHPEDEVR